MNIDRAVLVLKMMSNPTRLKILKILAEREKGVCVGGIEKILNLSQPSVSQHLAHLKNCEMLKCTKTGRTVCYEISDDSIRAIINSLAIDDYEVPNTNTPCTKGG